jgi:hypothetical protein
VYLLTELNIYPLDPVSDVSIQQFAEITFGFQSNSAEKKPTQKSLVLHRGLNKVIEVRTVAESTKYEIRSKIGREFTFPGKAHLRHCSFPGNESFLSILH